MYYVSFVGTYPITSCRTYPLDFLIIAFCCTIHFVSIGLDDTTATLVFKAISDCISNVCYFLSTCRIQFD